MAKKKTRTPARGKKSGKKPSAKAGKFGTLRECAVALHLSERHVQRLVTDGLPKGARGKYDVDKCLRFYVRYLQRKLKEAALPDPDGGYTANAAVRNRLLTMDADLKELDLAEKRGRMISIAKVGNDLAALVLEIKQRILQVPPRLAAEVIGEKEVTVVQDKIERALKEALIQLSKFDLDLVGR